MKSFSFTNKFLMSNLSEFLNYAKCYGKKRVYFDMKCYYMALIMIQLSIIYSLTLFFSVSLCFCFSITCDACLNMKFLDKCPFEMNSN